MRLHPHVFAAVQMALAALLLAGFYMAAQNVIETFPVASISALNNLQPKPPDYFLDLSERKDVPDTNKVHAYVDYFEHLLADFPNLWDAYGILGYCYHYLHDDAKAKQYLKTAIQNYPDCFWNYYNLAVILINEGQYAQASDILKRGLSVAPVTTLKRLFTSPRVYLPLLEPDEKRALSYTFRHIQETYHSVFILVEVLNHINDRPQTAGLLKKLKLELYAF